MTNDTAKYEEWLTTVANTRLIYNTMDELEDMLDNHSIHNNGIKRSFSSYQKMRSAYRDLKVEVSIMTDGMVNLDRTIRHYQKAWAFFRENLYRRTNPGQVAMEMLSYCYPPYLRSGISAKRTAIYQEIMKQGVSIPFLLLLLMKALPGYDSKDGDAVDMPLLYESVMSLLQEFIGYDTDFSVMPSITRAREEENKTRLMLLYHVSQILDTYEAYADNANLYDTASGIKANFVDLDIEGYWNECGGELLYTDFWQIEYALAAGTYFMTHWHKDADNKLEGIRYTLFIVEGDYGGLVYYILHPKAIRQRMKGLAYDDADQVWYRTEWMDEQPDSLPLHRVMYSAEWPLDINLTRCTDDSVMQQYDRWINHDCEIVKPLQHLEYDFQPNLYAITQTHLYIPSENEGEYFKVPKDAHEGLDRIHIDDNIGTMRMGGKTYLAFDELMLYIGTSDKELKEYGIERVSRVE